MLQIIATIVFFTVMAQLMVALSIYIWTTVFDIYKSRKKKQEDV